ncbi:MAG TPA: D-alanyl-D-alanine carboxypeptidase family protein [Bacillota bacterium]|jgi:D-alanyl-D-alanine carboxypeptidase (penicillin-binding protein 5/6)|nr:D-alanyl-D-alanine carboxypeptidase family protein [Peptococcaceae bacterium MAG4]NLW38409.1 D-alanyl-D-alanine carboxypeptidase [Peptococcaceae bacterium]HPZ42491.1 D-alanyl-D-alanine carboxypeptidase family protein [Bacillota bacterium]HQD75283.1 D-alanyl-D-alanine carboxypeptidase family protein [Bacillota bacterium]HUM57718.1 D-alanyl-D-alanine carboxypeptidase family protein [Bacillota bacterium]
MSWKKSLLFFLLFVFFLGLAPVQGAWAAAEPEKAKEENRVVKAPGTPETTAEAAVLMEPVTGRIIYEKEAHKRLPMASVTKLMTLLLATEAVEKGSFKLTDSVITSENAWEMGGSQIYLEPGEEMSLWDLLLAIGLQSANDASVAVAEHIAGSEEAFVQDMNDKARELGLTNTNFVNCHGLTAENHYTSAYDLAIILREGLKNPLFRKITAMKEYDLRGGAFKLWNTNKLLWWYKGADAGKTGWTESAKYCLASSAERDGLRLICVVLGTEEPQSHFRESMKLYDFGFARYKAVNIADQGEKVGTVKVGKGLAETVYALTLDKVSVIVPRGEEKGFEPVIELPEFINAPVAKGQEIGTYIVTKEGQEVLRVKLVAAQDVPKANILQQMRRVIDSVY